MKAPVSASDKSTMAANSNSSVSAVLSTAPAPGRVSRLLDNTIPCLILWLAAVLAGVYVKWAVLHAGGYRALGRALGRIEITGGDESRAYLFSWLERLSFFRADLLLQAIVLPLIGVLLLRWVGRRGRIWIVAAGAFVTVLFLYLQIHGFWLVKQFQSWEMWQSAIRWGLEHPEDARQYAGLGLVAKAAVLLGALAVAAAVLGRRANPAGWRSRSVRWMGAGTYAGIASLTVVAWCVPVESTAYHRASVWMCARALLQMSDVDLGRYDHLDAQQAMAKWRAISRTPEPDRSSPYFGAARDFDVICFVMETAPARCLDVSGHLDDMPNLKRLRQQAWVGANHLSTYPFTSRALFSLMTSWYPTYTEFFTGDGQGQSAPGLMQTLGRHGYKTVAYKPFVDPAEDEALQGAQGFSIIWGEPPGTATPETHDKQDWRPKATLDRAALERLKQDMAQWIDQNQRYAVLYLPQIGHAPWPDVIGDGRPRSVVERGRAVIALQDQWLGELVALLESKGRLDRTLIMVTGDHGIRTRREDPGFEGGLIDPYSFQVPFLLYAPRVLSQPTTPDWITSHLDVTPTLLDLVGLTDGREFEMGLPIWDQRLGQRVVFLWAEDYLGADGFYDRQQYGMRQSISDLAYLTHQFGFKDIRPLPRHSPARQYVIGLIGDGLALQYRITHVGAK